MQNNDLSKMYYKQRDGSYYTKMTKDEIAQKIDPTKLSTFIPILKDMNYAIILDRWFELYQRCHTSRGVIGRYIAFLNLKGVLYWDYEFTQLYCTCKKNLKGKNDAE